MKDSELMIGDWVINTEFGKNKVCQVESVELTRVWLRNCNTYVPCEFIEPIPLTQEILEKNGFIRHGTSYISMGDNFALDNPSSANDYKDNYWVRISMAKVRVEYVHELQRLLKSAFITKEIKL